MLFRHLRRLPCRHVPTCSEYSVQAFKQHGPVKGGQLAANRIARCHPWGTSGYDPVPKILLKKMKIKTKGVKLMKSDLLKPHLAALFVLISMLLISCQGRWGDASSSAKFKVLVSVQPQAYFVKQIAGDLAEVVVLIPPGTSPHLYDPNPQQMVNISDASIYFYNGNLGFEKVWINDISDNFPGMKMVNLSDGIDPIRAECNHDEGHGDHDHDHELADPHDWLSVDNAILFAEMMKEELQEMYPEYSADFQKNYDVFLTDAEALSKQLSILLEDIPNRNFMIFHPSLSYFARDYQLTQISIEVDGKEPTPSSLLDAINRAREYGIKTIFVQKEFDEENAQVIAREIDGMIVRLDPLSIEWDENMRFIAKSITNSFDE